MQYRTDRSWCTILHFLHHHFATWISGILDCVNKTSIRDSPQTNILSLESENTQNNKESTYNNQGSPVSSEVKKAPWPLEEIGFFQLLPLNVEETKKDLSIVFH